MASVFQSSGGFSYAQAAKGRTAAAAAAAPAAQTTSSKTTSAPPPSLASETLPEAVQKPSNWADDVEASVTVKSDETQKIQTETSPNQQVNGTPVDRTKAEEKMSNGVSGVSSPDLTASSDTTTKDDDSLSPPNGVSSESTWESRSQLSEPSWITERKERQNGSQTRENSAKDEPKGKSTSTPPQAKPAEYHESLPPPVNPWLKRAEVIKATKTNVLPRPAPPPTTPGPASISSTSTTKENQPPQSGSRRKVNSFAAAPVESVASEASPKAEDGIQERPINGAIVNGQQPKVATPKTDVTTNGAAGTPSIYTATGRQTANISNTPAPIVDQSSWPTPDSTLEKERKNSTEKESDVKRDDDTTPTAKTKKKEWNKLDVNHTVIFETPINELKSKPRAAVNGERGAKNGSGGRGRGGYRGNSHANGGDRQNSQNTSLPPKRGSDLSSDIRGRINGTDRQSSTRPLPDSNTTPPGESRSEFAAERNDIANIVHTKMTNGHVSDDTKQNSSSVEGQAQPKPMAEPRRMKTTNQHFNGQPDASADDFVPAPIPRRSSSGTQAQRPYDPVDSSARQFATLPRVMPSDRKDTRPYDTTRDPTWSAPRANKRGGRGRGGNGTREPANGHHGNHVLHASYGAEFGGAYGVQNAQFQMPRGGHHPYGYPSAVLLPGRGGWTTSRGGLRAQSIPVDNSYLQRVGYAPNGATPLSPINTFMANLYESSDIPMTAMPYPSQLGTPALIDTVIFQLDYYFSDENLIKDMFLRRHMDSKGFVTTQVIANFNRIRALTQDQEVIREACIHSRAIEIRVGEDGKERLRKADGWQQFVLPMDQRDESAQNEGPEHLRQPERPQLLINSVIPQLRGPASAGLPPRFERRSYDNSYSTLNGHAPQYAAYNGIPEVMYGEQTNGEEVRGRAARSPTQETPISPMGPAVDAALDDADNEPDTFQDAQIPILTVVVKMSEQQQTEQQAQQQQQHPSYRSLATRTFSNGSIDSRSIINDTDSATDGTSSANSSKQPTSNGAPPTSNGAQTSGNGSQTSSSSATQIPHLPPVPRRSSPNKSRSPHNDSDVDVFWVKDQEGPVTNLPPGLTSEPYAHLRGKALDQRNHAATGNCPYDMDVLYQFWCHFLIRNFNNRMYSEFKTLAHQDVARTNLTGLQNLLRYYGQVLLNQGPLRDRVVKDYIDLVRNEPAALQGQAFKQLRSAWRNGAMNLKNRKKVGDGLDEKLKEMLDRLDA